MKIHNQKIVNINDLLPNTYNPNRMNSCCIDLLKNSIEKYGFIFPLVVYFDSDKQKYRIIDGYHRYEILKRINAEQVSVIVMDISYHEAIQLTVLLNRIKGFHQVEKMSDLVVKLENLGLEDEEICQNLGMEQEEYLRLKQQLGIAHAFKNHKYSKSWEIKE